MNRRVLRNPLGFFALRWKMLIRNFFHPERFYEKDAPKYGLKWEILVLLFIGGIGAIGFYYGVQTILDEFAVGAGASITSPDQPGMDSNTARQLKAQIAHPIIGIFVLWVYYATAYYAGSWLFSGHGTYFAVLKNTAWALVPFVVGNLVLTIAFFITYFRLEIVTSLPGLPERNVTYLLGQGYSELPMMILPLVKIGVVAWVAYLGAAAINDAMQLPKERALQIAAVPAVLHAGYLLWLVLGRLEVV